MTEKEAVKALRLDGGLEITGKTKRVVDFFEGLDMAIKALEEIQQYRAVGTAEECRELKERNTPKKTKLISGLSPLCPECGAPALRNYDYCKRCGQAIDWSEEE